MRTRLLLSAFTLTLSVVACGDDTSGTASGGGGGAGSGGGTSGNVRLSVLAVATSSDPISGNAPDPGDAFVLIDLKLENGADTSLPLDPIGFAVQAAGGIEYRGTPLTEFLVGGCELDASVSPGGEATCIVAFSAPAGAVLESLAYAWEDGRVEASLPGSGGSTTGASTSAGSTGVASSSSGAVEPVEVFSPCPSSFTPDAEVTNEGSTAFSPSASTIPVGGIVRFAPTGPHNMTADDDSWGTTTSAEACIRFNETGAYPFQCSVHPDMTGTITVE